MTAHPSASTLTQRVNGLVERYTALSAQRKAQATCYKAEASYLYGAAAAFEVVATELWEALGKHGAMSRVAEASHLSPLAGHSRNGLSDAGDALRPEGLADITVRDVTDATSVAVDGPLADDGSGVSQPSGSTPPPAGL